MTQAVFCAWVFLNSFKWEILNSFSAWCAGTKQKIPYWLINDPTLFRFCGFFIVTQCTVLYSAFASIKHYYSHAFICIWTQLNSSSKYFFQIHREPLLTCAIFQNYSIHNFRTLSSLPEIICLTVMAIICQITISSWYYSFTFLRVSLFFSGFYTFTNFHHSARIWIPKLSFGIKMKKIVTKPIVLTKTITTCKNCRSIV